MVSSRICSTSEVNIGVSDNVRKLCATVPLKGPSGALRIGVDPFGGAQRTSDEIEQVGWFLEINCHQFPRAAMEQPAPLGGGATSLSIATFPSGQRGSSPGRGCAASWTQPTVRPFGSVHNASLTIPIIACTLDAVVVNAHKIVAPTVYAPTPATDISRSKLSFLAEFRPKQCRAGVQRLGEPSQIVLSQNTMGVVGRGPTMSWVAASGRPIGPISCAGTSLRHSPTVGATP